MNQRNKKIAVTAGSVVTIGALIAGVAAANKSCNNKKLVEGTTTTYSTDTLSEKVTTATSTSATSTPYDLETVKVNYSSPTRDSNETNDEGFVTNEYGEYGDEADVTIEELRETTPYDEVIVIDAGEDIQDTIETVSYETTKVTQPTDTEGTVAETTAYTEPVGTDPLPIEPTIQTVDLGLDSEYKESNNTKQNRKVLVLKIR